MDVKVSKDKHICRWVDRENLMYVRLESKTKQNDEKGDQQRKKKWDTKWSKASWKQK